MLYISKGVPEKEGISVRLRVINGGQVYTLFGLDETIWLRGRLGFSMTTSIAEELTVRNLMRTGLAECTSGEDSSSRYTILSRCIIAPTRQGKRVALQSEEKYILDWLRGAGLRLSLAELVFLHENGIKPARNLLGEANRQALVERIYTADTIDEQALEAKMEQAGERDDVINAVLGLLKKKRVVLL